MSVNRIYLIRHGETTWNADKRWQGQTDVPLSDVGRQQARLLAAYLRARPISAVYASDLARAKATGEAIAEARGLTVRTDARLREMHVGVLQGLTIDEIHACYPHELDSLKADWLDHRIEGGENRRMMQERTYQALEDIAMREAGPEVALVTHGGVVRVLLHKLFPDHADGRTIPIENTSLTAIGRLGEGWRLEMLAQTPHLAPHAKPEGEQEAQ